MCRLYLRDEINIPQYALPGIRIAAYGILGTLTRSKDANQVKVANDQRRVWEQGSNVTNQIVLLVKVGVCQEVYMAIVAGRVQQLYILFLQMLV